jgi:hypothetical protein
LVVDAVALMGGNEYLIQQMIDRLIDTGFRYVWNKKIFKQP